MPLAVANVSLCVGVGIVLILVPAFLVYQFWYLRQNQLTRRLAELRSIWGREHRRDRDLGLLHEFHEICPRGPCAGKFIDDATSDDLNLEAIFATVDRTITTAGEFLLYRILRSPMVSDEALEKRRRLIRLFQEDVNTRQMLQLALLTAGRRGSQELMSLVWNDPPPACAPQWVFQMLTALAILSLGAACLWRGPGWILAVMAIFAVNMYVHYRVRTRLLGRLGGLRQLGMLIRASQKISAIHHPDMADDAKLLRQAAGATRHIAGKVAGLLPEGSATGEIAAMFLEYVYIFFLQEVRTFHAVLSEITAHGEALKTLFLLTGELDAWQSVASFRAGLPHYVEPEFSGHGPRLDIQDATHPLLINPVSNSIRIGDRGIAITGSNMSGKTTFLRTIAANVLLAQTIVTCLATSYRSRKMRIISSMNEADNLLEGKSYYLAEAERLLDIVRQSEDSDLVLALIDEPLAGTNSPERLAASRQILCYLAQHNGLVMVSTHDVALVARLQEHFEPFHFADSVDDQGIRFDYRLRRGLDYHGNAIQVLKHLGYPDAIIDGALRDFSTSSAATKNQGKETDKAD